MKALVYNGPRDVAVVDHPDPRIERPHDAVIRITSTNICGSDLHMYEGRTDLEAGRIIGHENLGEVVEVGEGVDRLSVGDMVCVPFNVACGFCRNCEERNTGGCLTVVPGQAGGGYGYADMGPYWGGQAEFLRVPSADYNCLRLPEDALEKELDYVMLADIWPTGWHATRLSGLQPGESMVVFGSGPVGLMAAYSSLIQGADQVFVVDRHPDRLRLAEQIGAIPIDDSSESPVDQVLEATDGRGTDRGCECVGWQAHDPAGDEHPEMTMNDLVQTVRAAGGIGCVGVFIPSDPGGPTELAKEGKMPFDFGQFWLKAQSVGTGQAPVKRYNRHLRDLIHRDRAKPSFVVSHELPLTEAPDAYRRFDAREDGWTKVVLRPAA